jgi:hypothetical protein
MPWILGIFIGWFLFNPPVWLQSLGPLAYVVNLALCGLLLLSVVAWLIAANLPARVKMDPLPIGAVDKELRERGRRLEALGFRAAGEPRLVNVAPSAILLGYVHESEPVYATVFRTQGTTPKLGFDYVSLLHGEQGGLTTNADPDGATLPAEPGGLRQVFPDETQENLFQRHMEGLSYLRDKGIHCRPVSADTFEQDFVAAMARQRNMFLSSPLRFTVITLWRAATKQIPFVGRLSDQKMAGQQITRLLAGC